MSSEYAVAPDIPGSPKTVLVVEDDFPLRFTLAEWLRVRGYIAYEAASADEAVLILNSPIRVDMVVTDVDMPGVLNGLGLVEYIQNKVPSMNIIVVSGNSQHKKYVHDKIDFFTKPYDLEMISKHIALILEPGPEHD